MAQPLRLEPRPVIEIHSPATLNKIGEVAIDSAADVHAQSQRRAPPFANGVR